MEEKKNIDRLYQEKFKDFEAAPREDLWQQISAKLQEEQNKKPLLPSFFSRIAGVAAILSLFVFLGEWLTQPRQNPIVTNEKEVIDIPQTQNNSLTATPDPQKETPILSIEENKKTRPSIQKQVRKEFLHDISSISAVGIKGDPPFLERMASSFFQENKEFNSNPALLLTEETAEDILEEHILSNPEGIKVVISTHAGPIYYGNLRKGNFLDSKFNNNSTEGEVTYSYGFNIAYALTEKLKIRSGISKVSMSHNTNDVNLYSGANPMAINNVSFVEELRPRVQANTSKKEAPQIETSYTKSSLGNSTRGMLNQKIGFIEVPVELEYSLIDKKISVNIIGGASTLFLDENMISVSTANSSTVIGEASNINEVSFSTNIGVGFDYDLSEKFKLNLEPMFKYQLNAFDASSGTYQPFYLGIYTGFSYKF